MAFAIYFLLITLLAVSVSADSPSPSPSENPNDALLVDFYFAFNQFASGTVNKTLDGLKSTGVLDEFISLPNATFLFPVDTAYDLLPKPVLALLNGSEGAYILAQVLRYHVIVGYFDSVGLLDISYGKQVTNLLGAPLYSLNIGDSVYFSSNISKPLENITITGPDAWNDFSTHSAQTIPEILLPADLSVLLPPAPPPVPAPAPTGTSSSPPTSTPAKSSASASASSILGTLTSIMAVLFATFV